MVSTSPHWSYTGLYWSTDHLLVATGPYWSHTGVLVSTGHLLVYTGFYWSHTGFFWSLLFTYSSLMVNYWSLLVSTVYLLVSTGHILVYRSLPVFTAYWCLLPTGLYWSITGLYWSPKRILNCRTLPFKTHCSYHSNSFKFPYCMLIFPHGISLVLYS